MMILFDEIWFPCRSLCPASMRDLSYVKFISDSEYSTEIDFAEYNEITDKFTESVSLDDIFDGGYGSFIKRYYGGDRVDSHTHEISFGNGKISASPIQKNFILDLLILNKTNETFTHALNGLTRKMAFPDGLEWLQNDCEDNAIRVADSALSISSIYDLTGVNGPYHPVLEELREHDFVRSFRTWVRDKTGSLHNRSTEDVLTEMNELASSFSAGALQKAVGSDSLREISVDLVEGIALDAIPGASTVKTLLDLRKSMREKDVRKVSAFIADSQTKVWNAHQKSRVHLY